MSTYENLFFDQTEPSRKRRKVGDVFTMKTPLGYLIGRVVATDALWSSDPRAKANLLYIYRPLHETEPTLADAERLTLGDLLIPPVMTNNQGWFQGYFKTIGNVPIEQVEKFEPHCFYHISGTFWDEYGHELAEPVGMVGTAGLDSDGSISILVERALT